LCYAEGLFDLGTRRELPSDGGIAFVAERSTEGQFSVLCLVSDALERPA